MIFEKVRAVRDEKGRRQLVPTGEPEQLFECDDVLVAVGQENAFPWIERDAGIAFDEWGMPVLDKVTLQSSAAERVLRRRRGVRPEEHHLGGRARPRRGDLDRQVPARRGRQRAPAARRDARLAEDGHPRVELRQRRSRPTCATRCRGATSTSRCATSRSRSSSASTSQTAWKEAQRCLNCDVQTVFTTEPVHRVRRLRRHLPDGLHHVHRATATRADLRTRLQRAGAPRRRRTSTSRATLKTGRVMVKDEDVCLHCGLCAERCPTGAWDMQKFLLEHDARRPRLPRTPHAQKVPR